MPPGLPLGFLSLPLANLAPWRFNPPLLSQSNLDPGAFHVHHSPNVSGSRGRGPVVRLAGRLDAGPLRQGGRGVDARRRQRPCPRGARAGRRQRWPEHGGAVREPALLQEPATPRLAQNGNSQADRPHRSAPENGPDGRSVQIRRTGDRPGGWIPQTRPFAFPVDGNLAYSECRVAFAEHRLAGPLPRRDGLARRRPGPSGDVTDGFEPASVAGRQERLSRRRPARRLQPGRRQRLRHRQASPDD